MKKNSFMKKNQQLLIRLAVLGAIALFVLGRFNDVWPGTFKWWVPFVFDFVGFAVLLIVIIFLHIRVLYLRAAITSKEIAITSLLIEARGDSLKEIIDFLKEGSIALYGEGGLSVEKTRFKNVISDKLAETYMAAPDFATFHGLVFQDWSNRRNEEVDFTDVLENAFFRARVGEHYKTLFLRDVELTLVEKNSEKARKILEKAECFPPQFNPFQDFLFQMVELKKLGQQN